MHSVTCRCVLSLINAFYPQLVRAVRARETPVEEEKDISRNASIVSEMEMSAVPSLMEVVNLSYAHVSMCPVL